MDKAVAQFTPEKRISDDPRYEDNFVIEDLLDFPAEDALDGRPEAAMSMVVSSNSSSGGADTAGVGPAHEVEFCVPYEDLAELEWLSNFVEESFSSEDLQKLQLIQGIKARTNAPSESHQYQFQPESTREGPMDRPETSVRAKARSKRSRAATSSGSWNSRLLAPEFSARPESKKESGPVGGEGRRCIHCASEKTPQWRSGPMGPKTLCNACGVRYKSGRLVPEYRPASSPTFVLTRHSNSHRKVVELRRQKEMMVRAQQQQQQHQFMNRDVMFDDDSSTCRADFGQMV